MTVALGYTQAVYRKVAEIDPDLSLLQHHDSEQQRGARKDGLSGSSERVYPARVPRCIRQHLPQQHKGLAHRMGIQRKQLFW